MKKLLTALLSLLTVSAAQAATVSTTTDYQGTLKVKVLLAETPKENQTITVIDNGSYNYTLTISDFSFGSYSVGDVALSSVKGEAQADGSVELKGEETLNILGNDMTIKLTDASIKGDQLTINGLSIKTGMPLIGNVTVTYSGTKQSSYTTESFGGFIGVNVAETGYEYQEGTVLVANRGNNAYTLSIKDFSFQSIELGDIVLSNVVGATQTDGSVKLTDNEKLTLASLGGVEVTVSLTDAVISSDGQTLTIKGLNIAVPMKDEFIMNVAVTFTKTNPTALKTIPAQDGSYEIFSLTGRKTSTLNRGVNIIRYANGETKKVLVK